MLCPLCGRRMAQADALWWRGIGRICSGCLEVLDKTALEEWKEWKRASEAKTDVLVQCVPVAASGQRGEVQQASAEAAHGAEVRHDAGEERQVEALPLTYGDATGTKGRAC